MMSEPQIRTDQASCFQALQDQTSALQEELKLPGLSVAVCLRDGSVLSSVAGYADVERGFRMRATHRFSGGSISKTFVAALAHKAINDGKLNLDQPILSCSNREHWTGKVQAAEHVTVGMLLSHSAGLPDLPWLELYEHKAFRNVLVARTDYPAILTDLRYFDLPANHRPGKRQLYSDVHYIVLGGILEFVLGEKLEFTIQREILYPFQLNSTEPALSSVMSGLARTYPNPDGGNQSEVPL